MKILSHLKGDGLRSRALRGTAIALGGTGGQQVLRLLSNLTLTRLLFPEAFGLMALIQTFMIGLQLFSDIGIRPAIIQSARGEDPDFLDTAWTIQIGRGFLLWLAACGLAWPFAQFYNEPQILWLLPVVGINALIQGFTTTKVTVANRQIRLGRQTVIGLACQAVGLVIMIGLAFLWPTVWALVIGGIATSALGVWANHRFVDGHDNRLRWDSGAASELMRFGRFIFLSTLMGFLINHGEKLFLGKLVSFADLGIYNIAFFMAAFPGMLGSMVAERVLFPLYREHRPADGQRHQRNIRKARSLVTGGMILLYGILTIVGHALIVFLYDPRYEPAGAMLIMMAMMHIPGTLLIGSSQMLLAEGNSKDFSKLVFVRAVIQSAYTFLAFWLFGIFGLIMVVGLTTASIYPLLQYYLRKHRATDLSRDALFAGAGLAIMGMALWLHWDLLVGFYHQARAVSPSATGNWLPATIFGG